jgi:hypothetical protein
LTPTGSDMMALSFCGERATLPRERERAHDRGDASYQNGAAETFVYRMSGGKAQIVGYHVNSDQLILR